MVSDVYFPEQNGRIKVQIETLLGPASTGGWIWQAKNEGNNFGAQGSGYYYFRSETLDGSVKNPNNPGLFSATIWVAEDGYYDLRMRTARDTNDPGEARNDIWVRVDDDTRPLLPEGTVPLISSSGGFLKLKGAGTSWGYAKSFSAANEEDANAPARVWLTAGFHEITFSGRSIGLHIDFFEVFRTGMTVGSSAADTPIVTMSTLPATADAIEDGGETAIDVLAGVTGLALIGTPSDPAHGFARVTPEGTLAYTPDPDFFGTDSFTFTVADGRGAITSHAMTVTVAPTPDAPIAVEDAATALAGAATLIDVLANDRDPDGPGLAIREFDAVSVRGGSVVMQGGKLLYTPAAGFTGTDAFAYSVIDPTGLASVRAKVMIEVADSALPVVVGIYDTDSDALVHALADGDVIDAAALAGLMTLGVDVLPGGALDGLVGSMRMTLSGAATGSRTESTAPYALFGDDDGDFRDGIPFGAGSYSFRIDAYSGRSGKGTLLDSYDIDFTVAGAAAPPAAGPLEVGIYDTRTDLLVHSLADGDVIDAALLAGPMTIAVGVRAGGALDGKVGSVALALSGAATASRTESTAPYALFGDDDGDYTGGIALGAGSYALDVDAYGGRGGRGALLESLDFDFTVVDDALLV